jgi:hypothetical protein
MMPKAWIVAGHYFRILAFASLLAIPASILMSSRDFDDLQLKLEAALPPVTGKFPPDLH